MATLLNTSKHIAFVRSTLERRDDNERTWFCIENDSGDVFFHVDPDDKISPTRYKSVDFILRRLRRLRLLNRGNLTEALQDGQICSGVLRWNDTAGVFEFKVEKKSNGGGKKTLKKTLRYSRRCSAALPRARTVREWGGADTEEEVKELAEEMTRWKQLVSEWMSLAYDSNPMLYRTLWSSYQDKEHNRYDEFRKWFQRNQESHRQSMEAFTERRRVLLVQAKKLDTDAHFFSNVDDYQKKKQDWARSWNKLNGDVAAHIKARKSLLQDYQTGQIQNSWGLADRGIALKRAADVSRFFRLSTRLMEDRYHSVVKAYLRTLGHKSLRGASGIIKKFNPEVNRAGELPFQTLAENAARAAKAALNITTRIPNALADLGELVPPESVDVTTITARTKLSEISRTHWEQDTGDNTGVDCEVADWAERLGVPNSDFPAVAAQHFELMKTLMEAFKDDEVLLLFQNLGRRDWYRMMAWIGTSGGVDTLKRMTKVSGGVGELCSLLTTYRRISYPELVEKAGKISNASEMKALIAGLQASFKERLTEHSFVLIEHDGVMRAVLDHESASRFRGVVQVTKPYTVSVSVKFTMLESYWSQFRCNPMQIQQVTDAAGFEGLVEKLAGYLDRNFDVTEEGALKEVNKPKVTWPMAVNAISGMISSWSREAHKGADDKMKELYPRGNANIQLTAGDVVSGALKVGVFGLGVASIVTGVGGVVSCAIGIKKLYDTVSECLQADELDDTFWGDFETCRELFVEAGKGLIQSPLRSLAWDATVASISDSVGVKAVQKLESGLTRNRELLDGLSDRAEERFTALAELSATLPRLIHQQAELHTAVRKLSGDLQPEQKKQLGALQQQLQSTEIWTDQILTHISDEAAALDAALGSIERMMEISAASRSFAATVTVALTKTAANVILGKVWDDGVLKKLDGAAETWVSPGVNNAFSSFQSAVEGASEKVDSISKFANTLDGDFSGFVDDLAA